MDKTLTWDVIARLEYVSGGEHPNDDFERYADPTTGKQYLVEVVRERLFEYAEEIKTN